MGHTIFFSWQSDTPNNCGRSFLEETLKKALELLAADLTVESAVRERFTVDSDTKGVAGMPPIVDTIFKKIDGAAVFVADLTFVGKRLDGKRLAPNPNVLVEHGWALKSLSHSRMLAVMNTAYGEPNDENLPFDLKHLRWPITYYLAADSSADVRRKERDRLAKVLNVAIRAIVASSEFKAAITPAAPPPKAFARMQPQDGEARFRKPGSPLGLIDGFAGVMPSHGNAVNLAAGPAIWLRVMPQAQPDSSWPVTALRRAMTDGQRISLPLGHTLFRSFSHIRAEDGFGMVAHSDESSEATSAVVFVFVTGEVWSTNVGVFRRTNDIPYMEPWFAESFIRYAGLLRTGLNIRPPYNWIAGIEQTHGRYLSTYDPTYGSRRSGPCTADSIVSEGTYHEGDEMYSVLQKFFQKTFDVCGVERPPSMDEPLKALARDGTK